MFLIYTRKSTDDADNQKNSLEYQDRMCREYAQKNKIDIAYDSIEGVMKNGLIAESHSAFKASALSVSGAGLVEYQIERPKFMHMISWLLEGKYEGVVVLCWDRISRNEQSDLIVKELIDKHNISFRFVQAEYDHATSSGALHRDIDGMFARHHSRVTSEKVRAAFKKLRDDRRCTYIAPIGYLDEGSDNKTFDPERAPIIRRLFEQYATGEWSLRDLCKWSHEQGLTTKPRRKRRTKKAMQYGEENSEKVSKPIAISTMQFILTNPFYIGKLKNGENIIEGNHPPLISVSLFEKVQSL
ncbi:MAG TPA: recombinase family protein, partial [Candidatus Peribacteraceae bacterium]|nr:recombinase family protein [Candidatus Peribacteraceae bacterium]